MGRMKLLDNVINKATGQVEGYCVIKSVTVKSNVKGSDYLDMILTDSGGEVNAKLWDYTVEQHGQFAPDSIVKVRGSINLWKDTEQLKIDRIRNVTADEAVDMAQLVPCAPFSGEAMYDELYQKAETFENNDLKMLTQYILRENRDRLIVWPAASKLHHAMRGGLLFHTRTMLHAAESLISVYSELYTIDRDLVYAGIILHDVAKTDEITVGGLGLATGYSMSGELIGHINMGVANVERAAAELMIDEKIKLLVEHILLSHHGVPEYGSSRYPMFPEAEIVSQVDILDAKLFEMYDALSSVAPGEFSDRQWALDSRKLYKI